MHESAQLCSLKSMPRPKKYRKTDRRIEKFVTEYLKDLNQKQAAIRAGFSTKSAPQTADKLLKKANVIDLIERKLAEQSTRCGVSADRVIREFARIAFTDVRNLVRWDGEKCTVKPSAELTDDEAACIAGVREVISPTGDLRIELKFVDKTKALEALAKHFPEHFMDSLKLSVEVEVKDNRQQLVMDEEQTAEVFEVLERAGVITRRAVPDIDGNGNGNGHS